jgi:VanZ family protein
MILPLPKQFDANELFIIISTIFSWAIMFKLPRHMSTVTITIIWTFNVFLALLADITISVKPYEFYRTIDHSTHELFDTILHFVTYPTLPYFVVNFYQRMKPNGIKLLFYIILCSVVAIALEWMATKFHVFTYIHWKLYLSFFVYIGAFSANIWLSNLIEKRNPYQRTSTS